MKCCFLLFCLIFSTCLSFAFPKDSLRTENIEGKMYIIHQVDPQETLYALSRRYNVTVDDIISNNPVVAEGLKVGDVIRIPYISNSSVRNTRTHIVKAGETLYALSRLYGVGVNDIKSTNNLQEGGDLVIGQELIIPESRMENPVTVIKSTYLPDTADYQWHVVRQGETLFGLSKVYNKEIDQLILWNNLASNNLNIGDSVIVSYTSKRESINPEQSIPVQTKSEENLKASASVEKKEEKITREIVTNDANYEEIVETGLAELIENSGNTQKYLALHRSAGIGTIIRVKNEMNGREVFVRVLGRLPDTGNNEKLLMKISKAAYDRLGAIDKKFRVRISYFANQ